jgi:FMN reductase
MNITSILGSPSAVSRSAALLQVAQARLGASASQIETVSVRDLPCQALLHAQFADAGIQDAIRKVRQAQVVLVATPIYKAAYSGLLKAFLDLLPQDALRDKTVLPLATGGSSAHLLALDYSLKPVLSALGARELLDAVYASDAQIERLPDEQGGGFHVDAAIVARVERSLQGVIDRAAELHDEALAAAERDALLDRARAAVAPPAPRPRPPQRVAR